MYGQQHLPPDYAPECRGKYHPKYFGSGGAGLLLGIIMSSHAFQTSGNGEMKLWTKLPILKKEILTWVKTIKHTYTVTLFKRLTKDCISTHTIKKQ